MNKIIQLYESGRSIKAIAREIGLSEYKVRKILISEGVITSDYQAKINQLAADGKSAAEIAEILGASEKNIIQRLLYTKRQYNADTPSKNALAIRRYRSPIAVNRRLQGLSQAALAELVGVYQKDISLWECGERKPSAGNLKKLAEILKCKMEDLI